MHHIIKLVRRGDGSPSRFGFAGHYIKSLRYEETEVTDNPEEAKRWPSDAEYIRIEHRTCALGAYDIDIISVPGGEVESVPALPCFAKSELVPKRTAAAA